eukprot:TRINITY_DN3790_c0_g1_i2.p1 TRINITY_DN3790_c0_g1~~TRINITY_DN3790_c0_g1_i2.p1  ORF type:complete len:678 (-),score=141.07 TRINITY_DN3790_c0_g1_i2:1404-3260(-)
MTREVCIELAEIVRTTSLRELSIGGMGFTEELIFEFCLRSGNFGQLEELSLQACASTGLTKTSCQTIALCVANSNFHVVRLQYNKLDVNACEVLLKGFEIRADKIFEDINRAMLEMDGDLLRKLADGTLEVAMVKELAKIYLEPTLRVDLRNNLIRADGLRAILNSFSRHHFGVDMRGNSIPHFDGVHDLKNLAAKYIKTRQLHCSFGEAREEAAVISRFAGIQEEANVSCHLETNLTSLDGLPLLGSGSYGRVYLCKDRALKCTDAFPPEQAKRFVRELTVWSQLRDDNVVRFETFSREELNDGTVSFRFFMELFEGTLSGYLKENAPLCTTEQLHILGQVVSGLYYLHRHGIIHRDLHSRNVLWRRDEKTGRKIFAISDFGLSASVSSLFSSGESSGMFCNTMGSQSFICGQIAPPECQSDDEEKNQIGFFTDVFAFGILMFQIMGHEVDATWESERIQKECERICAAHPGDEPETKGLLDLMSKCLDSRPQNRPTILQLAFYLSIFRDEPKAFQGCCWKNDGESLSLHVVYKDLKIYLGQERNYSWICTHGATFSTCVSNRHGLPVNVFSDSGSLNVREEGISFFSDGSLLFHDEEISWVKNFFPGQDQLIDPLW